MTETIEIAADHPIYGSDRYGPRARLLRRWSLNDNGLPVCVADALDVAAATPEQIAEAVAGNASVRLTLGVPEPYVPPPAMADYEAAIDAHVEAVAQSRAYKSAAQCRAYANSTVPAWAAQAAAFSAWQDAVWLGVYATLTAVQGGAAPPAIADLIAGLPAMEWPG